VILIYFYPVLLLLVYFQFVITLLAGNGLLSLECGTGLPDGSKVLGPFWVDESGSEKRNAV